MPSELVSTVTGALSSAAEKVKELLPALGGADAGPGSDEGDASAEGQWGSGEGVDGTVGAGDAGDGAGAGAGNDTDGRAGAGDADDDGGAGTAAWSLPSLDGISLGSGKYSSAAEVALVPTDDYAQGYVFDYGGEQFTAYFDSYSWKVYDSYRITNHGDIVAICQALINEHPVYGSDWESLRTADDMAFEWEQHNLAYKLLPEDSHWRDDAKDVDLDPDDQGKTFPEIYESRTGQQFDIRNYLS